MGLVYICFIILYYYPYIQVKDFGEPSNRKRIEADAVCQVITCSSEIPKECQYPEKSEETKSEANVSVFEKKELDVPKLEASLSVKETMINIANKNESNLEIASNTFDIKSNSQSLLTKEIKDTDNEVELANSNVNECPSVKRGSEIILKKVMDHDVNASVMEAESNTNVVLPNNKGEETQKSSCQTSACEPIIEVIVLGLNVTLCQLSLLISLTKTYHSTCKSYLFQD